MTKKILLITGGTGGHVIPAENFAIFLQKNNINFKIILDVRGNKYLNKFRSNVSIVQASSLNGNIFEKIIGSIKLIIALFESIYLILQFKPTKVISFGSYASLSPLIACFILKKIMKIEIFIHEQNTVIGRTNKIFISFVDKIFLNFDIRRKIKFKLNKKTFVVGTPERNIKNAKIQKLFKNNKNFTIFIYGGSQGSEYLISFIKNYIKKLSKKEIKNYNFVIQCPKKLILNLSNELSYRGCNFIVKEYYNEIENILMQSSLVISRAGAGTINDLIKFKIPSVLIPLPNSKDDHQLNNAKYLEDLNLAIIIEQDNDDLNKVKDYINYVVSNDNKLKDVKNKFNKVKEVQTNELIYNLISNE